MYQAALESMLQAERRLANVLARLIDAERAVVLHELRQIFALDELHRDVIGPVDLVRVVSADDIRMAQLSGGADLAQETQDRLRIAETLLADDLQGDNAVEHFLAGFEDLPHAPFADAFQKDERAEDQSAPVAFDDLIDLIGRQPIAPQQFLGELARIADARLEPLQLVTLLGIQKLSSEHAVHKFGDRCDRHDSGESLDVSVPGSP